MIVKQNCWDFNKCGRGPGEKTTDESGPCPASTEISCSGLNNGINSGRICWAIAGSLSKGIIKGEFAREYSCLNCDFLKMVCMEEDICEVELLTPHWLYNHRSRIFGRRKFMRIDIHFDMIIIPPKYRSEIVGVTTDFSFDGFSFISENINISKKDYVEFRIEYPEKNESFYALAEVAWKKQIRDRCLVGMKIRFIQQGIKNMVLDYAYDRWIKGIQFN